MIITIYYSKTTGEIHSLVAAENKYTYERFAEFEQEMRQVLDIMYINYDNQFFRNYHDYKINLDTLEIEPKSKPVITKL